MDDEATRAPDSTDAVDAAAPDGAPRGRHGRRRGRARDERSEAGAGGRSRGRASSAGERVTDGETAARPRRTQAERSAATTERILDATVQCLADRGHAATSTNEIARLAGVSRGALLHHFATKDELLAAAVTHVFARSVVEFRARISEVPEGPDRSDAGIDVLWQIFRGPTFDAWLELIVAGRTDRSLQRHVARETESLAMVVAEAWDELAPSSGASTPMATAAPLLLFSMLEGMALNRHTGATVIEDATPVVLAAMKDLARLLATEGANTRGGSS